MAIEQYRMHLEKSVMKLVKRKLQQAALWSTPANPSPISRAPKQEEQLKVLSSTVCNVSPRESPLRNRKLIVKLPNRMISPPQGKNGIENKRKKQKRLTQISLMNPVPKENILAAPKLSKRMCRFSIPQKKKQTINRYYVGGLKKKVKDYIDEQVSLTPIVSHFMESLSIFRGYRTLQIPSSPHLQITLPTSHPDQITLLFDMDETLLHSEWKDGESMKVQVRPHVIEVLNLLKKHFQIGLFTAGKQSYVKQALKCIPNEEQIFAFKLFRQSCFQLSSRAFVKDLRIFQNRNASQLILIDNLATSYLFQRQNAVPITSFCGDRQDNEMLHVLEFLLSLKSLKDVRPTLRNHFRLHEYEQCGSMEELADIFD